MHKYTTYITWLLPNIHAHHLHHQGCVSCLCLSSPRLWRKWRRLFGATAKSWSRLWPCETNWTTKRRYFDPALRQQGDIINCTRLSYSVEMILKSDTHWCLDVNKCLDIRNLSWRQLFEHLLCSENRPQSSGFWNQDQWITRSFTAM